MRELCQFSMANTIRTNLNKIHSHQNHAICVIFHKDKFSHTKEFFEQNKVLMYINQIF